MDIIFQTIYELCTNEAVKGHISSTRKNVADFFDYDVFVDTISLRIAKLEPDGDNFYTIPLSVVLASLAASCSEKKIQNLLAKMKANQDEIFLDSALPLEAPPVVEELKAQVKAESADFPPMPVSTPPSFLMSPENNEKLNEARELIAEALLLFGVLRQEVDDSAAFVSCNGMIKEDQLDIFRQIENAFNMVSRIYGDVTRITEVLGFQDLSGQQILKIIKLLSDFQVQLLAIMVSFGSQLKSKERDTTVTPQESKRMAQEDVDHYFKTMTGDQDPEGPLDQDTVNKMLEDFGF